MGNVSNWFKVWAEGFGKSKDMFSVSTEDIYRWLAEHQNNPIGYEITLDLMDVEMYVTLIKIGDNAWLNGSLMLTDEEVVYRTYHLENLSDYGATAGFNEIERKEKVLKAHEIYRQEESIKINFEEIKEAEVGLEKLKKDLEDTTLSSRSVVVENMGLCIQLIRGEGLNWKCLFGDFYEGTAKEWVSRINNITEEYFQDSIEVLEGRLMDA